MRVLWNGLRSKAAIALALTAISLGTFGAAQAIDSGPDTSTDSTSASSSSDSSSGITPPGGGGGNVNNEVVVINTVDDRFVNRAGFGTARVTGDEAHNQNAAAATSSCVDCRTVAVAVQIVLIERTDASVISPRNFAIAINNNCLRCETFAAAYQYVITTDGLVRFTPEGQQRLTDLQAQIRGLAATEEIGFTELEAQIDAVVDQMWAVVDDELVAVGVAANGVKYQDVDEATEGDTASPTPSPSGTEDTHVSPSASPSEPAPETMTSSSPTTSSSDEPSPSPSSSP